VTTLRLANAIANPSVRLSSVVSVVCDVRAPYSGGLNFRGYFTPYLHHPATHSPKITKIVHYKQISLTGL